jgi:predicted tellurium resistance membrane protein TerC
MCDLPEDKQTRKKRRVLGWLLATIELILLNVSIAFLSVNKLSTWKWALFGAGLAFLGLALSLVRSSPLKDPES